MSSFQPIPNFPRRCPDDSCKAPFCREHIVGIEPRFLSVCYLWIKCRSCGKLFGLRMPIAAVDIFKDNLPQDDEVRFERGRFVPKGRITVAEEKGVIAALQADPRKLLEELKKAEKDLPSK